MTKQTKKQLLQSAQRGLELRLIYLSKSDCSISNDATPYDLSKKSVDVGIDLSVDTGLEKKQKGKEIVIYPCRITAEFKDNKTEEVAVRVVAEFRALYSIENKDLSKEARSVFGEENVMYHVYPYFREFLQSQLRRMELPSFTMPMLVSKAERVPKSKD